FVYNVWLRQLNAGRSFVTTGPMLFVNVDDQPPGHTFQHAGPAKEYRVYAKAISSQGLDRFEIVVNGEIVRTVKAQNSKEKIRSTSELDERIPINGTAWIAVRCFEDRPDKRIRFAHSSPVHIEVPQKPLKPRKPEIEFLTQRVKDQL